MPLKNRYILILGRNPQEASMYARRAGLPNFTYRAVSSAKSIRKIQVADVHVLPGFHDRPDKHSILRELRWGRDIVFVDVEMPAPADIVEDQGDGMGPQLSLDDEFKALAAEVYQATGNLEAKAMAEHGLEDEIVPEPTFVVVAVPDDTPVPEHHEAMVATVLPEAPKPKVRRKRCNLCGIMVTGADDEAHDLDKHKAVW